MTRGAWHTALKSKVSSVSTDAALFSANGSQLVHHYRVFGECAAHVSLHGTFMIDLRYFTARASANAKWAAKRDRTPGTGSPTSSDSPVPLPRSIRQRRSDDESPACKAPRVVSPVMTGGLAQAATSTIVSVEKNCARRYQSCVRFPMVGGGQVCLYRCRFQASPSGISCRLLSGHLWSRPSSIRHLPVPGRPLSA